MASAVVVTSAMCRGLRLRRSSRRRCDAAHQMDRILDRLERQDRNYLENYVEEYRTLHRNVVFQKKLERCARSVHMWLNSDGGSHEPIRECLNNACKIQMVYDEIERIEFHRHMWEQILAEPDRANTSNISIEPVRKLTIYQ